MTCNSKLGFAFTKRDSGVLLNLVKMKSKTTESGHNCYTNTNSTFSRVFTPNIFNPPKLLNITLNDVTISNKLTSPSNWRASHCIWSWQGISRIALRNKLLAVDSRASTLVIKIKKSNWHSKDWFWDYTSLPIEIFRQLFQNSFNRANGNL